MEQYLPFLLRGAGLTVVIAIISGFLGIAIGILVAGARLAPYRPLRWVGGLYVNFLRSTPLFIQLVLLFYALPILTGLSVDAFVTGVVGLAVYEASYFAENFRAGVLAVPIGQREAAISQGMTLPQAYRKVLLPQAIRLMLPPTAGTLTSVVKDSALVSVLGVADLLFQASALASYTLKPLEVLSIAGFMYIMLAYPLTVAANILHRRYLVIS
jgi:His/Glu/Gln/Arg/opine family amino acid ABC transporter permease subunit